MFAPEVINNLTDTIAEQLEEKLTKKYHPTVSREEAMDLIGCSAAAFNEIRKRDDFQFVHIEGISSRYSTANLIEWINGRRK
ncbi:hypothetical protein QNJ25_00550 [Macrococcus caseolyticus]|uniref:hypothetical protein n=1 Tax=Macrococcoides caseolyticum TaxID=69966 RepID=UPI0024BC1D18|nr:hypothetical protein [Macrococcus caseolyticus]MDJ1152432.1 hypothetical protein [Macrococcus caseolyticus]